MGDKLSACVNNRASRKDSERCWRYRHCHVMCQCLRHVSGHQRVWRYEGRTLVFSPGCPSELIPTLCLFNSLWGHPPAILVASPPSIIPDQRRANKAHSSAYQKTFQYRSNKLLIFLQTTSRIGAVHRFVTWSEGKLYRIEPLHNNLFKFI